ncbi:MAG: LPXTG cell wall anchor domain-containing protein [Aerococcus sp.]|nr:LPXTG cell wall anchor domain-containing protein [Aerococcus sp.]
MKNKTFKWRVIVGSSLAMMAIGHAQVVQAEENDIGFESNNHQLTNYDINSYPDTSSMVPDDAEVQEKLSDEEVIGAMDNSMHDNDEDIFSDYSDNEQPLSIIPKGPDITPENITDWEQLTGKSEDIYRSTVPLVKRSKGSSINSVSSSDAKVISLAYLNTNSDGYSAVGGNKDGMNTYAFDYWQYLDQMVAWEQVVPPVDMIDAAHKNGVPIYGTIFFKWSDEDKDVEIVNKFLERDTDGHFKAAKKLVDIAEFYGFDGYFINQETVVPYGNGKNYADDFIAFMTDAKRLGKEKDKPIEFAWYDSMTNSGFRSYINGVNESNNHFVEASDNNQSVVDEFFMNFDWLSKDKIDGTVKAMQDANRSPFDAYAGLELQKGGAYQTNQKTSLIVDENGKLKVSLGLFVPDSVRGFASDGVDYHTQEDIFWTGHTGNPIKEDGTHDDEWSGISRFVVDKTVINQPEFFTTFNPGHGNYWFVDGKKNSDRAWASRGIQTVMPTWRYWIANKNATLSGAYDFETAYNGGNSLKFSGNLENNAISDIMLYATHFIPQKNTILELTYQSNVEVPISIGVATSPDYSEDKMIYFDLMPGKGWQTSTISLAPLKGQMVYALKVRIKSDTAVRDYALHLGQLAIKSNDSKDIFAPESVEIIDQRLFNAQEAEAIISVNPVKNATTYEVYQENNGQWQFINGASEPNIYLPFITRGDTEKGNDQRLAVIAIGKEGTRSEPTLFNFHWGIPTSATTQPQSEPENIMKRVNAIEADRGENAEMPENMLTGTITGTSDKWFYGGSSAQAIVTFDEPVTVVQYHIDHAGAGGEDVEKKLMNTKDFNLEYYDELQGKWVVASEVRDNHADTTDIVLDQPVTAKRWKLNILQADNGSPWGGVRIYNWKMYETINNETRNLPMVGQTIIPLSNANHYAVRLTNGIPGSKVTLYRQFDKENNRLALPIASTTVDKEGNAIFMDIELPQDQYYVFYQTAEKGKSASNVLALIYGKETMSDEEPDDNNDPDKYPILDDENEVNGIQNNGVNNLTEKNHFEGLQTDRSEIGNDGAYKNLNVLSTNFQNTNGIGLLSNSSQEAGEVDHNLSSSANEITKLSSVKTRLPQTGTTNNILLGIIFVGIGSIFGLKRRKAQELK